MGRAHGRQQQGDPHRPQEGDRAQHGPCRVAPCFRHHGGLRLGPQFTEHVELGVQRLRPEPDPALGQLGELLGPVPRVVDALARRLDPAGPEQRLQPQHHPGRVLDHTLIGPSELLQRGPMRAPVIDRP